MSSDTGGDATTRERILDAARTEVAERGASLTLGHVATRARVSRQAVYLHFGDRTGLLLALVRHMDEQLQLGPSLEHVMAAPDGSELIRRTMELHARFNAGIDAVAQMLEGAQYHDEALGQAWRDRLTFRHGVHRRLVDRLAAKGDPKSVPFPMPMASRKDLDFSFSGLKTAARLAWEEEGPLEGQRLADYCASLQDAIIRQLLDRLGRSLQGRDVRACYLAGGVAANRTLLAATTAMLAPLGIPVHAPSPRYCTDNGAMVACAGAWRLADTGDAGGLAPFPRGVLRSWGAPS